jgi:hypothetical protein
VEDRLLSEAEFADRGGVRRLSALAEGRNAALIFVAKLAVIDDEQPRARLLSGIRETLSS